MFMSQYAVITVAISGGYKKPVAISKVYFCMKECIANDFVHTAGRIQCLPFSLHTVGVCIHKYRRENEKVPRMDRNLITLPRGNSMKN